ncbi:hypothetical protein DESA109040_02330 [Deinococcus saxicola]|uniref:UvrD-helicase domain-containing protein n=1 Tax=Deinococcus saxicola TaxID=249406 RepID=UPI0039EFDCD0
MNPVKTKRAESGSAVLSPEEQARQTTVTQIRAQLHPETWRRVAPHVQRFTPEQLAVVVRGIQGENVIVKATAGSGKSTLIEVLGHVLPRKAGSEGRMGAFAFSTEIARVLKDRLPRDLPARSFHSFGRQILTAFRGELVVNGFKRRNLVHAHLGALGEYSKATAKGLQLLSERMLVELAPNTPERVRELCERLELDFPETLNLCAALQAVADQGLAQFHDSATIDFYDMLYLPMKLGLGRGMLDLALVDEAQDFNRLQHRLIRHVMAPGAQIIFVGDPHQAIFRFTGADPDGMDAAGLHFGATTLHLSYTFRCPVSHVRLAEQFSPNIRTPPGAAEGEVWNLDEAELPGQLQDGDLVLCRTNAPLMALALTLIARGTQVEILGQDVKKEIVRILNRAFPVPFSSAEITGRLERTYDVLLDARYAGGEHGQALVRGCERDADLLACCGALAARVADPQQGKPVRVTEVIALLEKLLSGKGGVRLATIHMAKGLEAERVALLRPADLDPDSGEARHNAEALAVAFVAYTRAKLVLMLVGQAVPSEEFEDEAA